MQTIYSSLYQTIFRVIALAAVIGVAVTGCSNEPMQVDAKEPGSAGVPSAVTANTQSDLIRVVVTLRASADVERPADAELSQDAALRYLSQHYPDAKVLRSMPSFSQVIVELPSSQLEALRGEQMVKSAQSDQTKHTMQNTP